MYDYTLKFQNKAKCEQVLFDRHGSDLLPKYDAVDVIGFVTRNVGTEQNPVPVPQDGYRANVRTREPAPELDQYVFVPDVPDRVWC